MIARAVPEIRPAMAARVSLSRQVVAVGGGVIMCSLCWSRWEEPAGSPFGRPYETLQGGGTAPGSNEAEGARPAPGPLTSGKTARFVLRYAGSVMFGEVAPNR
jgi:hypothetical protein